MVIRNRIHPGQFIGSFYVPERGLVVLPSHRERHSFQCTDAVLFSLLRQPCLDDGNEERQPEHRIIPRPPSRIMSLVWSVDQSDQRSSLAVPVRTATHTAGLLPVAFRTNQNHRSHTLDVYYYWYYKNVTCVFIFIYISIDQFHHVIITIIIIRSEYSKEY